jgi:hypothetical protein
VTTETSKSTTNRRRAKVTIQHSKVRSLSKAQIKSFQTRSALVWLNLKEAPIELAEDMAQPPSNRKEVKTKTLERPRVTILKTKDNK